MAAGARKAAKSAFQTAVASGDRRKALEALRDRLAKELDEGPSAALAKALADVLRQIDGLADDKEPSTVDDLKGRRAARRRKAAVPKRAAKSVKRRAGGGRARR